ncbi:cytochrome oxidase subunit I [Ginsengibacter hankyongi]|uniref:Cytochrome oxidase subunit I n=1 Tax=Ginsengibacter hankyongi TaxID=2607284 RepID=A0A5J5IHE8_9BACT|nr:cbb3-type cytochrome c oxidase subunit I [Ginsengibacter hankyongi]KAA9037172.1 cytochrome oxidase subunit I [Ginsengibacter hankyongi]
MCAKFVSRSLLVFMISVCFSDLLKAQTVGKTAPFVAVHNGGMIILFIVVTVFLAAVIFLKLKTSEAISTAKKKKQGDEEGRLKQYISNMDSKQIEEFIQYKQNQKKQHDTPGNGANKMLLILFFLAVSLLFNQSIYAQPSGKNIASILGNTGVIITIILILIPILLGIVLMIIKVKNVIKQYNRKQNIEEAEKLAAFLKILPDDTIEETLIKRKAALDYKLLNNELSGQLKAEDEKGLININTNSTLPVVAIKKKALKRPNIDAQLSRLILWYIGCATFWLLFGTTIGEYLGIKFVAPDVDHLSWLSFGRLRPVHTNVVFWGWASLGMLGLGYYIVPTVSNTSLASIKKGWLTLILINASVVAGTLCLMAGINNSGGEYREYTWPVMLLFAIGLVLTLINFLQTVAKRKTKEIYISNWYMIAAVIFAIIIVLVAYIPFWSNGLGDTIVQGYYMHQGVGMWFMLFTLGIVYYMLPQQLNKPIYSYSLGILAFWTQILFYTLIGTHHFVFSAIPWWLQTVAIAGSAGMIIPVVAGTTNFLMTFKGAWYKIAGSYTLPFFLVGILFYFTGSMQGTAEAFRTANLYWHFTDFTVAHSHLTMYGIICFFVWAGIYAVVPRITGKEPPQITVGAHFWLALIGLLFYTVPLMYGSTIKGMMWMQGKPFIDGVVFMAPYWLWRAIGGSLMWVSHLFFAYNIYKMLAGSAVADVKDIALEKLKNEQNDFGIIE